MLIRKPASTVFQAFIEPKITTNFYNDIKTIKEQGALMAGYGGNDKIAFVSPNDIAEVAFEELTALFQGKKVRYVASEELTCNEAAKILSEAIGKPDLK